MKKIAMAAASCAAVLGMAACSTDATSGTDTATSADSGPVIASNVDAPETSTSTPTQMSEEEMKDEAMRMVYLDEGIHMSAEDAELTGLTVCQFVREGNSLDQLFLEIAVFPDEQVLPTVSNDDLPYVIGVSIARYCPEYEYLLG